MNNEKVKEIKEALECCAIHDCSDSCIFSEKHPFACLTELHKQLLTYINELESENERLLNEKWDKEDDLDNYHIENTELKDRIAELESELEKEQINNLNCDTELQYKEKRIAELEKENIELLKENEGQMIDAVTSKTPKELERQLQNLIGGEK